MNFLNFAAVAVIAAAVSAAAGVNQTLAFDGQLGLGLRAADSTPNTLPPMRPLQSLTPTALVAQSGDVVFCTETTNVLVIAPNVGVFQEDDGGKRLCIPIEGTSYWLSMMPALLAGDDN